MWKKGVEGDAKRVRVIDIKRKGMGCEREVQSETSKKCERKQEE